MLRRCTKVGGYNWWRDNFWLGRSMWLLQKLSFSPYSICYISTLFLNFDYHFRLILGLVWSRRTILWHYPRNQEKFWVWLHMGSQISFSAPIKGRLKPLAKEMTAWHWKLWQRIHVENCNKNVFIVHFQV